MTNNSVSRRSFLFKSGQAIATLAVANVGIYALGSAVKNLDGSLVAGAKAGNWVYDSGPDCNTGEPQQNCGGPCNVGDVCRAVDNDFGGMCGYQIAYTYVCK